MPASTIANAPVSPVSPIETVDRGPKAIARATVVAHSASEIFQRLQDPRRHHELDGSGTVRDAISGPSHLAAGDTFTVAMKMFGLPYKITSRAVAFEQDRLIEWRHPAGHTWRWELEPLAGDRTRVTEIWDFSENRAWLYKLIGMPGRNAKGIEATLILLQHGFPTDE